MAKETVYRKHLVKDGLPKENAFYFTDMGQRWFDSDHHRWTCQGTIDWWLEPTELNVFTDEELEELKRECHKLGAIFAYGKENATKLEREAHFDKYLKSLPQ